MNLFLISLAYGRFHYGQGLILLGRLGFDFSRFWFRFFSIADLGRTFFSPWQRLGEDYKKSFNPQAWAETFLINTLMRLFGMGVKSLIFGGWILATAGTVIFSLLTFIVWLLLPFLIGLIFLLGGRLIF